MKIHVRERIAAEVGEKPGGVAGPGEPRDLCRRATACTRPQDLERRCSHGGHRTSVPNDASFRFADEVVADLIPEQTQAILEGRGLTGPGGDDGFELAGGRAPEESDEVPP